MEHNLSLYGVGMRYVLCLFSGMIGGLMYSGSPLFGTILLISSVVFFLEAILAFDPILYVMGKNQSKNSVKDFE